jgi:hypothetical protein
MKNILFEHQSTGCKKQDKGSDRQRPGMKWCRSLKPTEGCGTKEEVLFEQKKIMKSTAFCGKRNRDYAACLKNSVHFLVA